MSLLAMRRSRTVSYVRNCIPLYMHARIMDGANPLIKGLIPVIIKNKRENCLTVAVCYLGPARNNLMRQPIHYHRPTKLREGDAFSRVCHSVRGWKEVPSLVQDPAAALTQPPPPQTCSKLLNLDLTVQRRLNLFTFKHGLSESWRLALN